MINPSTRYIAVRNYAEIFNDILPNDKLKFIRAYPTDLLVIKLSKINAILFQELDIPRQTTRSLEILFPGTDSIPLADIKDFETSAYFASASISLLLKACMENFVALGADHRDHPHSLGLDLLKTILIFNGLYFKDDPSLRRDSFEAIFRLDMQQQAYIRSNVYQKMFTMVKFAFASKFLSEADDLSIECREFCAHFQIANPWFFGKFILMIFEAMLAEGKSGKNTFNLEGIPPTIISEFTIDRSSLERQKPLSINMDIIPKPLYLIGNNAVILDYNFFQYAIDQGFFYLLYKNTSLSKGLRFNSYNAFQGYIGYHYFEQYLVKKYLSAIFYRPHQKVISSEQYQDFIIKATENKVLVIEVKSSTFHAKTLEEMDFNAFRSTIDQNLLTSKSSATKNKGLSQIVKQIEYLYDDTSDLAHLLGISAPHKVTIYPIIIYSDPNFDVSGVNDYVNEQFDAVRSNGHKQVRSIKPVTLINIHVLIKYYAHMKQGPSQLTDLISGYFSYIRKNKKKYIKEGHLHEHYLANISFEAYLRRTLPGDHLVRNLQAMEKDFDLNIPAIQ
ncbi:hypothetical protein [Telluribacter humicola]|uniref:hypothetical protein n=1 Tax=Telluribacter humicola TaxID=1720261 RepID=UPI001A975E35|nr:hypothetical protein [Telluribacter humicola]